MFEEASRKKLRFATNKGLISTEDLWDIPLTHVDILARSHSKELKDAAEESFIKPRTKDSALELGFEILKHVIEVRLAEREVAKATVERGKQRKLLVDIIAKKKVEALSESDIGELEKQLAELV